MDTVYSTNENENIQKKRYYPSLSERFSDYTGDYTPEDLEIGSAVGEEF